MTLTQLLSKRFVPHVTLLGACAAILIMTGCAGLQNVGAPGAAPSARQAVTGKAALLVPLSGPSAPLGQAMVNAAQMAIQDIGAGSFELIVQDTGTTPQQAMEAGRTALASQVDLVLGPVFADAVAAVQPLMQQAGVPMLSFSTHASVAGNGTYLLGILPETQIDTLMRFARERNVRPVHAVLPDNPYGRVIAASLARAGGTDPGRVGHVFFLPPQTAVWDQQLPTLAGPLAAGHANSASTAGLLIGFGGPEGTQLIQRLQALGVRPGGTLQLMGTGLWDDPAVWANPLFNGAVYASGDPAARARFEVKYAALFGNPPPRLASLAYDAAALAGVLYRTGQGYSLSSLTQGNGFRGAEGVFRLTPSGVNERLLSVLSIQAGRSEPVLPAPAGFAAPSTHNQGTTTSVPASGQGGLVKASQQNQ